MDQPFIRPIIALVVVFSLYIISVYIVRIVFIWREFKDMHHLYTEAPNDALRDLVAERTAARAWMTLARTVSRLLLCLCAAATMTMTTMSLSKQKERSRDG